jgi:uncharacterized Zn finger protein (UPF0148 family)
VSFPCASSPGATSHIIRSEFRCDGSPDAKTDALLQSLNGSNESLPTSESSTSLRSRLDSAPSTPPTPNSTLPAEPPFPAIDPATLQARRQQSDQASQEIGQLLLKGWMLLGDECPNATCHGIPLMKRPTLRPSQKDEGTQESKKQPALPRDPRKFCVICHQNFVGEREMVEYNAATAQASAAAQSGAQSDEPTVRGSSKRRYDNEAIQASQRPLVPAKRKGASSPRPPALEQVSISVFCYVPASVADYSVALDSSRRHQANCGYSVFGCQTCTPFQSCNCGDVLDDWNCCHRLSRSRPYKAFPPPRSSHEQGRGAGCRIHRCDSRSHYQSGAGSLGNTLSIVTATVPQDFGRQKPILQAL